VNNKKSKKKAPFIGWLVFLIIMFLSSIDEYQVRRILIRFRAYDLKNIAIIVIAVIVLVVFLIKLIKARKAAVDSTSVHSHDRLNTKGTVHENREGLDHYRIQLDGFLQAGIIDKEEYRVLYEKYRKTLSGKK